ncbi:hypothetical protein RchiOBHm_Chr2g0164991 [Rosa chinensis]|uniref:Uncharacterized protein n=1 Tax=Rosa chinensis TaxID=74649 RepID=A0A2P6S3P8_ROSCH|nr:hypothetical protein RchiOBHm_Chr2g0164991 [Rosa chinensis]
MCFVSEIVHLSNLEYALAMEEGVKKRLCVDYVPIERFGLVLDLRMLKMKRQMEKSKSCGTSSTSAP